MTEGLKLLWFEANSGLQLELSVLHMFGENLFAVLEYDGAENAEPGNMRVAESPGDGTWWIESELYVLGSVIENGRRYLTLAPQPWMDEKILQGHTPAEWRAKLEAELLEGHDGDDGVRYVVWHHSIDW